MNPARGTSDMAAPQLDPFFGLAQEAIAKSLEEAYNQYWLLPDEAPIEEYCQLYQGIIELEMRLDPITITNTLTCTATTFHRDTSHCPFCRERGPLHLRLADNHRLQKEPDTTPNVTLPPLTSPQRNLQ